MSGLELPKNILDPSVATVQDYLKAYNNPTTELEEIKSKTMLAAGRAAILLKPFHNITKNGFIEGISEIFKSKEESKDVEDPNRIMDLLLATGECYRSRWSEIQKQMIDCQRLKNKLEQDMLIALHMNVEADRRLTLSFTVMLMVTTRIK